MRPSISVSAASSLLVLLALGACSLAPDYKVPAAAVPSAYKESVPGAWVEVRPEDLPSEGAWWTAFHDPQLNDFEESLTQANQNLKAALALYDQARAAANISRAAYFPSITAHIGATREQISNTLANQPSHRLYNDFTAGADLSYEIDLWGRVRNLVAANEAQAAASAADLAGVALSLHAQLAIDYLHLRGDDMAQDILDKTVAADQQAYDLTRRRFKGGIAPEVDVDQAETQLENAKTQATDMRLQRAQLEHAIAILIGKAPANFTLPPASLTEAVQPLDAGVPSLLLQRRPDIAAAERRVAAANANIGVARAAWFPAFSITAMLGLESASAADWFSAPSHVWSLGPQMLMPLFEGGQINALNDEARAAYEQTVAEYRQTVLTAYGEVEDNLAALHRLAEESQTQAIAAAAAERTLTQDNNRYRDGVATYLDVVTAQNNELQARLAAVTISVRRMTASVQLIRALGGGWQPPSSADPRPVSPAPSPARLPAPSRAQWP
ncbi:MAG: efflux transporter outer membrane subunit [Pseudomonadota bacterium]|nr:efflux transporter outer membrane subunit [Pseudomonadota bacterium]